MNKEKIRSAARFLTPVFLGVLIGLFPCPEGLTRNAWVYFALFVALIAGLILEPLPPAALGFIGVTLAAVLRLAQTSAQISDPGFNRTAASIKWALSGFGNTTVWLIFGAFMFALGYTRTGLGKRIALGLVKRLGRRTLGLGYAVLAADLALAPFTPSNTARSGGTIFPVILNIPALYGSKPDGTERRLGSYLMWTAFASTCLTSSLFLTSMAPNLLAVGLVRNTVGIEIGWMDWLSAFLPPGILLVAALPWVIYKVYPPQIKSSPDVPVWAAGELKKLGPISRREWTMAALVVSALLLWIFGGRWIHPTAVALSVIVSMLVTKILSWDDILGNRPAWNVLVWFATLVTMADGLNTVGFVRWAADGAAAALRGFPPLMVLAALVVLFFLIHYMFASITAHVTAVLPVLLAAGAAIPDFPLKAFALMLCGTLGIMGILTPYATGPAPVYFASGYISRRDFWRLGLFFGLMYLVVFLVLGIPYLSVIGLL